MWKHSYAPTVAIDFDGVLHSYKSGWQGETTIPDEPNEGAVEFIETLKSQGYQVIVNTTRGKTEEGIKAVQDWLQKWGFPSLDVTDRKPPAIAYIDDRSVKFDGDFNIMLPEIEALRER